MIDHSSVIHRLEIKHQAANKAVKDLTRTLDKTQKQEQATQQAQQIVQDIAATIQQRVHQQIAQVVTRCLNAVFDDPYEFKINFVQKRGRTEAELTFVRNNQLLTDPLNEVGGGVIDVAAFALRIAVILLSRPPIRRVLFLDEPFSMIRGEQNKQQTRQMLLALAEKERFQFILNTDIPTYRLGTVIELPQDE